MKKTHNYSLICAMGLACLLSTLPVLASPVVIDFEDHASMSSYAHGTTVTEAAKLTTDYLPSYGVSFSSSDPYCAVVQLGSWHTTSGVNGLAGTKDGKLSYSGINPINASFFNPSNPGQLATTDFVSLRTDKWVTGSVIVTLEAFDIYGQLIASDSGTVASGMLLSVSANGIHSVQFKGSETAIDDFTFNPVTPIPEPATVGLMGGVAIGIYWIRHRFIV